MGPGLGASPCVRLSEAIQSCYREEELGETHTSLTLYVLSQLVASEVQAKLTGCVTLCHT